MPGGRHQARTPRSSIQQGRAAPLYQEVSWPTRSQYLKRLTALRTERSTWVGHWEELTEYILPRQSRFVTTDRNRGIRKDQRIINSAATRALRVAEAGMMSGITSPARPWFKVTTKDPDLAEVGSVKEWMEQVAERIRYVFNKSNFYPVMQNVYENLLLHGTAAAVIEEDWKDVIRVYLQPIGAYMLAQNGRCEVDTIYREMSLTVGQLVKRFGLDQVSQYVLWNWKKGNYDLWTYVVHVVEPNVAVDNVRFESKYKAFRSAWFELGVYSGSTGYDTSDAGYAGEPLNFLLEGGYDEFPCVCPRWQTTGMEDVYGSSPAMDCLGDVKALQMYERRKAMAVDKTVNPPMAAPASLKVSGRASLLPGDVTYIETMPGGQKFEPAIVVHPNAIQETRESIKEHVERINASLYADVWVMLQQMDDPRMTATEVAERKEEKMLQLGPVLERLHGELLGPAIERTFNIMLRRGLLPPPPPELHGQDLEVEYVSIMAQAQKALGMQALQTTVSFATSIAQIRPDVVDNLNVDAMLTEAADIVGLKPSLLLSEDQVQKLRQQRAQQQQAAQQAQLLEQGSKAAKNLSGADVSSDNGLTRLLQGLGGPAAAVAGAQAA